MKNEKTKILIIDDDAQLVEVLKLYLEKKGYYARGALTGKEAFEILPNEKFDIALCDYNLPDIKGLELVKEIMEKHPSVVTVFVTGLRSMELAMESMRAGVHDYLVKPIDYDELNKVLEEIIREKEKFGEGQVHKEAPSSDSPDEIKKPESEEGPPSGVPEIDVDEEEGDIPDELKKKEPKSGEEEDFLKELNKKESGASEPSGIEKKEKLVPRGYKLAESRDKEKTIFDFVIDKTVEIKKSIIKFALFLIFLSVVFFAADAFFLQFTGPGRAIHNRIWPPGLIIESVPSGAAVEIETESGRNILPARSRTPVNLERINPGTYSLSMEHEGFNRVDKNITVTETSHDGSNILIPGSSREYTDSITQKFIIPFEITLHIDSNPREADVFINERKLGGVTPITLELPVDRYNIVIEKEDYVPLGARQIGETTGRCVLDLRPGKANDIDERYWELDSTSQGLFSLKGSFWREVSINSNPERARVFIDGEQVGFTPYNARLPAGEHKVEISREGFTSWEGELSTDEKKEINADLKKKVLFNAVDSRNTSKRLDADLTIDGSKISGKTPREVTLTPGKHRITFSKSPDYETWSREINIVEQKNITARMKRGRYPVTVEVLDEQGGNPVPEASVLANGRKVGETGGNGRAQINISPQRQTLKISAPGYAAREITHDDPLSNDFVKVFLLREGEAEYGPQKPDPETQNPADEPESPSPGTDENSVVILDTRPDLPGAEIYFNGEKVGETIRRLGDVPGGSHSVEIDHPYTGRVESSVNIEPGERVIVRFNSVGEAVIQ